MIDKNDQIDINEEDIKEEDYSEDELADDTIDWKAEALKSKGIAKRRATKLAKVKEKLALQVESKTEAPVKKEDLQTKEFDYGQKAFLTANGIKTAEEQEIVRNWMENTGKILDDVPDNKYLQAELKELREAVVVKGAIPTGNKRSAPAPKDTVDYWLAKGELPPEDQIQLRRDVVNARYKKESPSTSKFSSNPVVGA